MYAGEIIETGTKSEIFKKAVHPYTWALMKSVPSAQSQTEEKLYSLKGTPPDLIAPPKACAFAPRCEYCMGICRRLHPVMAAESESHSAGCWLMHPDAPKPEQAGEGRNHIMEEKQVLVRIEDLCKYFRLSSKEELKAVDHVSFDIFRNETVGIVGESGCGKTTLGRTVLGLYPATSGRVLFDGMDVHSAGKREMREFKKHAQIMLQDPYGHP